MQDPLTPAIGLRKIIPPLDVFPYAKNPKNFEQVRDDRRAVVSAGALPAMS
jgi:hypothetical protein